MDSGDGGDGDGGGSCGGDGVVAIAIARPPMGGKREGAGRGRREAGRHKSHGSCLVPMVSKSR